MATKLPSARLLASGDPNKIGKRKLAAMVRLEARATPGLPKCPIRLKGIAKEAWEMWTEELETMGLDSRPDAPMLEGACVAFRRAVQAEEILETEGLTYSELLLDKKGEISSRLKVRPEVAISKECWGQVARFCDSFGFNPVSRSRLAVQATKTSPTEDLEKLLSGPSRKPKDTHPSRQADVHLDSGTVQ